MADFYPKIAFICKDRINATFGCVIIRAKNYVLGEHRDKPDFLSDRLLEGKLYRGWNFVDNNKVTMDTLGHGTAVAGIAAAVTNNTYCVAGTAPFSTLLAVKVTNTATVDSYLLSQGIQYAANYAQVINVSAATDTPVIYLQEAVEYAYYVKNRVVIAATGNQGASTPYYPAAYTACIGVGATDGADVITWFSNRGPSVEVVAPGYNILTTVLMSQGIVAYVTGTSASAPFVSGLASLLRAKNPLLSAANIRLQIDATCVDLGAPGFDSDYGYGRIDAFTALATLP